MDILRSVKAYLEMQKGSGVSEYLFSAKNKDAEIEKLKNETMACQKCPLAKTRKNVVFGAGSINAKLVFVGEAPGHDEDVQGQPFVGKAGMLLTKIIEAMGFKREDVYICNILKCRPSGNRNPLPEEIAQCIEHLYKQIDLIKPDVICGLGKFASQTLLNTETPISQLRGRWHEFRGIKFMPTFHPAYLLRNPNDKKLVWQDMKNIMEQLDVQG
ncbi:MAG: uracil-DNA glycosylase [Candidatus Omnitrophica bacterium]|nr:uracil-DNA glycosylase [Candidatus Omnitrophota bacterium]MBU4589844.1 uracil-DNA glycosylase [Candidatus Omnitrophota bacterium]